MNARARNIRRRCFCLAAAALLCGCRTPKKRRARLDPEIERTTRVARAAFQRGAPQKAIVLYERALKRAKALDDSIQIGQNAYNLAACLVAIGDYPRARLLLKEAAMEFSRAERPNAQVIFLQAKVARLQDQNQEAGVLARAALESVGKTHAPDFRAQVHLLMADLACDNNDSWLAETQLHEVQRILKKVSDSNVIAQYSGVSGRLLLLKSQPLQAALHFDIMANVLSKAGNHREMVDAVVAAAQAYAMAGEPETAADRYFRAARSLYASDRLPRARRTVDKAFSLDDRVSDVDLKEQVDALAGEIDEAMRVAAEKEAMEKKRTPARFIRERLGPRPAPAP
jgi:tetratricopeptide (TPR) repeat protein